MARQKLSDELETYGYVFSVRKTLLTFIVFLFGMVLLGRIFGLCRTATIVIVAFGTVMLPFFIRNSYRNRFYQKRFSSLNIYIEQFLYSFQKSGKILVTLKEVGALFPEDHMGKMIEKAVYHIEHTYTETDVERTALGIIEKEYPCTGLNTLHEFALQTEDIGGDYGGSILLLLEDRRAWADRVYEQMQLKKKKRGEIILSIIASLLLAVMVYVMAGRMGIDVSENPVSQVVTCGVLVIDIFLYYRADARLSVGYFDEDSSLMSEEEASEAFKRFRKYSKSGRHSLALHALRKRLTREVEKCFSGWLMSMSLLLQTENVQVAIFRSYENAPGVLKPPLAKLIGRLRKDPTDKGAYADFLSELSLPQVRSTMKMLDSISEGSGGDAAAQIADIIRRTQKMEDKAAKLRTDDMLAGMYALFLAPQITGGVKLLVDMILLFAVYMGRMV